MQANCDRRHASAHTDRDSNAKKSRTSTTRCSKTIADLDRSCSHPTRCECSAIVRDRLTLDVRKRIGDPRRKPLIEAARRRTQHDRRSSSPTRTVVVTVDGRRLHQARVGRHVPRAEPRRTRRDRHREPQKRRRRLRTSSSRRRIEYVHVLHQQRPRVSGLRAYESPRLDAPSARHGAGQPAAACRRASTCQRVSSRCESFDDRPRTSSW